MKVINKLIQVKKKFGGWYLLVSIVTTISRKISPNSEIAHFFHKYKYKLVVDYLIKNNQQLIMNSKEEDINSSEKIGESEHIWICWWQGITAAPPLVKACIDSIKKNNVNKKVILIDKVNYTKYINLPSEIIKKVDQNIFSITFLSDIIRMSLLSQYGGVWIDSTVLINTKLDSFDDYEFFTAKHNLFRTWHVSRGRWTGFFIGCGKNNVGIKLVNNILIDYALKNDTLIAYLLVDAAMTVAYQNIESFKEQVDKVPINNQKIFKMEKDLNLPAEDYRIPAKVNKLSYKRKYSTNNTVYEKLIEEKLNV